MVEKSRLKLLLEKSKAILKAHKVSSKTGLEKLISFAEYLENKLQSGVNICEEEEFFIKKLYKFVYYRGESLFQYRDIKDACNTNNNQEGKFKLVKQS
ncbi:MAG: hypothetical protein ACTSRG_03665 [Candidatus Helarchaeota archaeon]